MTKGWKRDPSRHALASRGVKSTTRGRGLIKDYSRMFPAFRRSKLDKELVITHDSKNKFLLYTLTRPEGLAMGHVYLAQGSTASLEYISSAPTYVGLGSKLLKIIEDDLEERGYDKLELIPENSDVVSFYKRYGYRDSKMPGLERMYKKLGK